MAKKDPTDLTVEEKLKALYQLQTTLSAIDEKRALRGELPLEVQDLEDDIAISWKWDRKKMFFREIIIMVWENGWMFLP